MQADSACAPMMSGGTMAWLLLATTISGITMGIWTLVGALRLLTGLIGRGLRWVGVRGRRRDRRQRRALQHGIRRSAMVAQERRAADDRVRLEDVCALVPAHNEEVGLADTLAALVGVLPPGNIYVVSDGSTDGTSEIVRDFGLHVVEVWPNRGKAGAIVHAIEHVDLRGRYKAMLIVDADTEVDEHYLERALPLINQPGVVAVAGHAHTKWHRHTWPQLTMFYPAYRVRLYRLLQTALRYGQTWGRINVTMIVPGFASMYRTSILDQITIDAKGLVIEDFNMTFELHRKRLGRIAYSPRVVATAHDPDNLRDFMKQVTRWNLGMMQTVRRHGIWPSMFWLVLGLYLTELVLASSLFLLAPVLLVIGLLFDSPDIHLPLLDTRVSLAAFGASILVLDYALTAAVAAYDRKPQLLIYGLGFFLLRYLDAILFLRSIPTTFTVRSDGRWESPRRYRYGAAPAVMRGGLRDAADDATLRIAPPDPVASRAGRLAMVAFSALSAALAVALAVLAVGVIRGGDGVVNSAAAQDPGGTPIATETAPEANSGAAGPIRVGSPPPLPLPANAPSASTSDPTEPPAPDSGPAGPIRVGSPPAATASP